MGRLLPISCGRAMHYRGALLFSILLHDCGNGRGRGYVLLLLPDMRVGGIYTSYKAWR